MTSEPTKLSRILSEAIEEVAAVDYHQSMLEGQYSEFQYDEDIVTMLFALRDIKRIVNEKGW